MIEKAKEEKIKTTKKLTPPRDGFDSLLQRITTSFLLRIPNEVENLSNNSLQIAAARIPPKKKYKNKSTYFFSVKMEKQSYKKESHFYLCQK